MLHDVINEPSSATKHAKCMLPQPHLFLPPSLLHTRTRAHTHIHSSLNLGSCARRSGWGVERSFNLRLFRRSL